MSLTPAVLYLGGQLGTSAATLFTADTNTLTLPTKCVFTNTDTVARLLTVYLVRSGGTASAANILIDLLSIAAGASYEATELEGEWLNGGDFVQAKCDAATVMTCTGISGFKYARAA